MNFLVFVDAQAGELEKILSGIKSMVIKEVDSAKPAAQPVNPGDSLYFLRYPTDSILRVKATVVRLLSCTNPIDGDISQILKEMQPRLQLTEAQYHTWTAKSQVQLVEFADAHKIEGIQLAAHLSKDRSDWIAFEQLSRIMADKVLLDGLVYTPLSRRN